MASLAGARIKSVRTLFIISTVAALIGCLCLFLIDYQTPVWMIAAAVMFFGLPTNMTSIACQRDLRPHLVRGPVG